MRNSIITILLSIFITSISIAQDFEWAKRTGGSDQDIGFSIYVDDYGNVYSTGEFEGTVDFDPGSGTYNLTSLGDNDIFIQKLDVNGNFVWAIRLGGSSFDSGYSIASNNDGSIYVTGAFCGTVDFDPGSSIYNLTSEDGDDIFILKINSSGNFIWARSMGGTYMDLGNSIHIDDYGNIYTSGYFSFLVDFDPGIGVYNLYSQYSSNNFIQKLDSNGIFIWAKSIGANGLIIYDIALDSLGNVYSIGYFSGTVDFDPGSAIYNLTSTGNSDIVVRKLNSSGDFVWAIRLGGSSSDKGYSIAYDAAGYIYITGTFNGTADFWPGGATYNLTSAGNGDIFIQKLDLNGDFVWAKRIGGVSEDYGKSIFIDDLSNVYITGAYADTVDFDPGIGVNNLISNIGCAVVFFQKLDANGNFGWAKGINGSNCSRGYSIVVDDFGNTYTIGYFRSTADFDPGSSTYNMTSVGGMDIFLLKLKQSIVEFTSSQYDFTSPPFDVNFTNTSIGFQNYEWDFGDANISSQKNPSHTYLYNGAYTVTLYATDTINNYSDSATCIINCSGGTSKPLPPSFISSQTTFSSPPFNVLFTNTSSGYHGFYWNFGDGDTSIIENPTHMYTSNGVYQVTLFTTDTINAYTDSVFAIISCAGLGFNTLNSNGLTMVLFPTPNDGNFMIEINTMSNKYQVYQLEVYTVKGKLIHREDIYGNLNIQKQFNFETLSKGVYLIRLSNEDNVLNTKFIIE